MLIYGAACITFDFTQLDVLMLFSNAFPSLVDIGLATSNISGQSIFKKMWFVPLQLVLFSDFILTIRKKKVQFSYGYTFTKLLSVQIVLCYLDIGNSKDYHGWIKGWG